MNYIYFSLFYNFYSFLIYIYLYTWAWFSLPNTWTTKSKSIGISIKSDPGALSDRIRIQIRIRVRVRVHLQSYSHPILATHYVLPTNRNPRNTTHPIPHCHASSVTFLLPNPIPTNRFPRLNLFRVFEAFPQIHSPPFFSLSRR